MATPALLATKYAPPGSRPDGVERPGLVATLGAARAVALVSAPPGYGKTTLVASWLAAERRAAAWLTLDEADGDPAVFLAYLVAAVRRAAPSLALRDEGAIVAAPHSPSSLTPLLNELAEAGEPLVIVLDDYHVVGDAHVHGIVAFFASHLPTNLRLVIATRQDPPLPLARLRARGQLVEIRAADLRFAASDAARFMRGTMGLEISDQVVDRLAERTEGWVAGLQLAGLSLRGHGDPDAFVEGFGASDRYVFDYLADEALARQPPDTRAFLEATSVLDRLSGPVCDALTGRTDGAATLAAVEEANLFLAPLDERREWYRYHGLFADLLRSALPPARRVELHRAAADWFARHDLPLEGIRHHGAAGEPDRAATLMETVADAAFARGEFRTILGWCDTLPASVLAGRPSLGVSRVWAQFFTGDIAGAEAGVRELTTGDGREGVPSSPRLACLEAWIANRHDQPDAEQLARRAIEGIPVGDPVFRGLALTTLGEALIGRDVRAAAAAFEEAHDLAETARRPTLAHGTVYSLATAGLVMGKRRDVEALCRRTIDSLADRRGGPLPSLGMVHLPLGVALFEADELVQARQHIATGLELCDRAGLGVTMLGGGEWHEILGLHLVGEADRAWRRLAAVRRLGERHGIARISVVMRLLAANLHLLEGDPAAARMEIDSVPRSLAGLLGSANDRGRHTRARVLLAVDRPLEALDELEGAARVQRDGERCGPLISTLVLMSVAHDRLGDRTGSAAPLSEAIALASDQDYRRAFMDGAAPVTHLLPGVREAAPTFVDDLLARLASASTTGSTAARPADDARPAIRPADGSGPMEPLSVRELEVLRLVTAGLSNDEIGRELYVTTGTAKWHVHNVLAKVGSRNRAALIARARSLGLV